MFATKYQNKTTNLQSVKKTNEYDAYVKNGLFVQNNEFNSTNNEFDTRIEIPTGSYEGSKLRNIYDLAGNMYEWTTEVGDHSTADPEPDKINITR